MFFIQYNGSTGDIMAWVSSEEIPLIVDSRSQIACITPVDTSNKIVDISKAQNGHTYDPILNPEILKPDPNNP